MSVEISITPSRVLLRELLGARVDSFLLRGGQEAAITITPRLREAGNVAKCGHEADNMTTIPSMCMLSVQ